MPYTPERTKAAIFAAGVEEFVAHGLAGSRVDRIAAAAGADKKAIYLYFGNKRTLFEAVLAHELSQLAAAVPLDADDIPGYVGRLFDYQRHHPDHIRLLMWEALELGPGEVPGEAARTAYYRQRPGPLAAAQEDGRLDLDLAPAGLWLALVGMVNWTFAVPQMARMALGSDPIDIDAQRRLLVGCARHLTGQDGGTGAGGR